MTSVVRTITVVEQTVVNNRVVAGSTRLRTGLVYRRPDGSEYVLVRGRRCTVIKDLALTIR